MKSRRAVSKKIVAVLYVSLCGLFLFGFTFGLTKEEATKARIESFKSEVDSVINGTIYIKDPRATNLCFAYYRITSPAGGLTLATVPCESIPTHMLITATIK